MQSSYRQIQIKDIEQPVYEINLKYLSIPYDICLIMEQLDIRCYNYQFKYRNETIKYGLSRDVKSINYGERIYRQSGHLVGWPTRLMPDTSGNEMRDLDQCYHNLFGEYMNRNHMKIRVIDMTNVVSDNINDPVWPLKKLERELIKRYQEKYNRLPIGNIRDESHIDYRGYVGKQTFDNLFEEYYA